MVLRHAERPPGEQGPVLIRNGRFVWRATVDVASSASARGATPKLHLLDPSSDVPGTWTDNRTMGNYSLSHDDRFAVLDDASVCPAHP